MTIDILDTTDTVADTAADTIDTRRGHDAAHGDDAAHAAGSQPSALRARRSARRARAGSTAALSYGPLGACAGGIRSWPAAERPRERLYAAGAQALSDSELLALFVRTGIPGHNAVDVGRAMLHRFGSLGEMLEADAAQLATVAGLGPAKIAQLQAISEIVKRSLAQRIARGTAFGSPSDLGNYLQLLIGGRPHEVSDARTKCFSRSTWTAVTAWCAWRNHRAARSRKRPSTRVRSPAPRCSSTPPRWSSHTITRPATSSPANRIAC